MTEQEVEGVLQQKRSTCTMAMEERVGDKMVQWDGFVRLYICEYGKSWHNRLLGRDEILVEEWFWVYFDPSGRAKKVLREVHGGIDSGAMVINLEKKRISRTGH